MRTINRSGMYYELHDNGFISTPKVKPSRDWSLSHAVRFNNFGKVVEIFSLEQVLTSDIKWHYKNGKQRVYIVDCDHGTYRTWMSPNYEVI